MTGRTREQARTTARATGAGGDIAKRHGRTAPEKADAVATHPAYTLGTSVAVVQGPRARATGAVDLDVPVAQRRRRWIREAMLLLLLVLLLLVVVLLLVMVVLLIGRRRRVDIQHGTRVRAHRWRQVPRHGEVLAGGRRGRVQRGLDGREGLQVGIATPARRLEWRRGERGVQRRRRIRGRQRTMRRRGRMQGRQRRAMLIVKGRGGDIGD